VPSDKEYQSIDVYISDDDSDSYTGRDSKDKDETGSARDDTYDRTEQGRKLLCYRLVDLPCTNLIS
jgi:hypothetical protein